MRNPFLIFFPEVRHRKRDYSGSHDRASNPLFEVHRPSRRWLWWFLLVVVLISGAGAAVLAAPQLRISEIRVEGTQKLNPNSIISFVNKKLDHKFFGVPWRRVSWLTPTDELASNVRQAATKLVPLSAVTVTKQGRTSLAVTITEFTPDVLWQRRDGTRFFINDRGVILEGAPATLTRDLPVIIDANALPTSVGSLVVNPSVLQALLTVRDRLPSLNLTAQSYATWPVQCTNSSATALNTNTNTNGLTNSDNVNAVNTSVTTCDATELARSEPSFAVLTTENWEIRLTAATNITSQLDKLATTLRQKLTSRKGLKYIDVRFGDRVYFK